MCTIHAAPSPTHAGPHLLAGRRSHRHAPLSPFELCTCMHAWLHPTVVCGSLLVVQALRLLRDGQDSAELRCWQDKAHFFGRSHHRPMQAKPPAAQPMFIVTEAVSHNALLSHLHTTVTLLLCCVPPCEQTWCGHMHTCHIPMCQHAGCDRECVASPTLNDLCRALSSVLSSAHVQVIVGWASHTGTCLG